MNNYRDTLDEIFVSKLGYEFHGTTLPIPGVEGKDNLNNVSKEYSANGVDVILADCKDRIPEFQKKLIKHFKNQFPDSHFLFISNEGSVFDLYNVSSSQKFKKITYNEIDRNTRLFGEKIELFNVEEAEGTVDLKIKIDKAFDTSDKITKKFYDKFQAIHKKLTKAISGIKNEDDRAWYASVLLNRLMFIFFLQKQRVIQDDVEFLLTKFEQVENEGKDYYRDFLLPLFFYGFARRDSFKLKQEFVEKYGYVKYLNGGLFYPHQLEKDYTPDPATQNVGKAYDAPDWIIDKTTIRVDNKILKNILEFLNGYTWYLDNRPMRDENDINPDVLGYIFEKYINQKELGAYYTKEDITGYISKNTIIPFILDKLRRNGFDAPDPNPMITDNEDIIANIADYLEQLEDYDTLKFLYKDVLTPLSVLDPAVGSGAFLFAALNILLPIYRKAIFKLKTFCAKKPDDSWLQQLCATLSEHSEEYFLTKQIILNNLYGVDIVEEATEICKLRLFLQLAYHLPNIKEIEPLPDIDFNIYAGNSLVGGLSWDDLEANYTMDLFTAANRDNIKKDIKKLSELKAEYKRRINEQIRQLSELKTRYRQAQQTETEEEELNDLKGQIDFLENEINQNIDIGIENPFHWFIEFYKIIENSGFDVVIGNPPYVEYNRKGKSGSRISDFYKITGYKSEKAGNLYAYFIERSLTLCQKNSRTGLIVPVSFSCTKRMKSIQDYIKQNANKVWISHFAERPSKLFTGAEVSLDIILAEVVLHSHDLILHTTNYNKWVSEQRDKLFRKLTFCESSELIKEYSIPKIGKEVEVQILRKLNQKQNYIRNYIVSKSQYFLCCRNAGGRYYKITLNYEPTFWVNGEERRSSTYRFIYFKDPTTRDAIGALMNSNLFYWHWIVYSDVWHMIDNDILPFPIELNQELSTELVQCYEKLLKDFEKNSEIKIEYRNSGKDEIKLKKFYAKYSKQVIDEIDSILANHYNFTDFESSYITKYDLQFRTLGDE